MIELLADSQSVWTIYSIGSPNFMYKVFNAIAMLGDGGVLMRMGQIGFLVGLFVLVYRVATASGALTDVRQAMIAGIIFAAMFGTTTTVKLVGMVPTPGGVSGGDVRIVDNVPWGIAAIGSVISGTGVYLTRRMETAFRDPTSIPVTEGGFGQTAEILASVRSLSLNSVPNTLPAYDYYRRSMLAYLRDCAMRARQFEILSDHTIESAPDPLSAIRWENGLQETRTWLEALSGESRALSCPEAHSLLQARQEDAVAGLDPAYLERFGATTKEAIGRALASVANRGAEDAQAYMAGAMINALWLEAASGSSFGSMGNNNTLMIRAALEQRRTQWVAEETMFMRTMRPMIGYFESFFYALSPFIAFLIGLGAIGLRMIVKYVSLTLAVALWMPVLAITNLYQITTLQDFFAVQERMAEAAGSGIFSLSNNAAVLDQATEAVALASMIAAATPMLTLTLLFGGAVAATSLFSRLQGQDHINEKIATPDVVNPAAALQAAPGFTGSPTLGATMTGADQTALRSDMGQQMARVTRSMQSEAANATASANTKLSSVLSSNKEASEVFSDALRTQFSDSQALADNSAFQTLVSRGYSANDVMALMSSNRTEESLSAGVSGELGLDSKFVAQAVSKAVSSVMEKGGISSKVPGGVGASPDASSAGSQGGTGDLVRSLGKTLSAGITGSVRADGRESESTDASNSSNVQDTRGMSRSDTRLVQLARQEAIEQAWDASQQQMVRAGVSASDAREISTGLSESVSKMRAFEQSAQLTEQFGTAESISWLAWSNRIAEDGTRGPGGETFADQLRMQASELGGEAAYRANLAQVQSNFNMPDPRQASAYASLMTLQGIGPGAAMTENTPGLADRDADRMSALTGAYTRYFAMSGPRDAGEASANAGVGAGAPAFGAVEAATVGAGQDAPASRATVEARFEQGREAVVMAAGAAEANKLAQERAYGDNVADTREQFDQEAITSRNADAGRVADAIAASDVDKYMAMKKEAVSTLELFNAIPTPHKPAMFDAIPLSGSDRGRTFDSFRDETLGLGDDARDAYAAARYMQANSFDIRPFVDSGREDLWENLPSGPMREAVATVHAYLHENPGTQTSELIALASQRALDAGEVKQMLSQTGGSFGK